VPDWLLYAGGVALVFGIRILGVALGTLRILLTSRGMEVRSAVLGFVESFIYVIGIGVVVQDLTNVTMMLSYCLGFSAGNVLGIRLERRMALGYVSLRVISRQHASAIAEMLRQHGQGATLSHGEGRDGSVGIVTAVVARKNTREAMRLVQKQDPSAFLVVDEARAVSRGWLPSGLSMSTEPPLPPVAVPQDGDRAARSPREPA